MKIKDVKPGKQVRVPGTQLKATVLRIGAGSADVLVERPKERTFVAKGKVVHIKIERERSSWSLETEVEVIRPRGR